MSEKELLATQNLLSLISLRYKPDGKADNLPFSLGTVLDERTAVELEKVSNENNNRKRIIDVMAADVIRNYKKMKVTSMCAQTDPLYNEYAYRTEEEQVTETGRRT